MLDDNAVAIFALSANTGLSNTFTAATNKATVPASYTFVTTHDHFVKIFSGQCDRVNSFIYDKLEHLERSDDDRNEDIVEDIAFVIDLVGEPASCTAAMEARLLKGEPFMFERLLLAIATARHKETEADRLRVLRQYTDDKDYRIRRAAVRALGRMNTEAAKSALNEIRGREEGKELGHFAGALLR